MKIYKSIKTKLNWYHIKFKLKFKLIYKKQYKPKMLDKTWRVYFIFRRNVLKIVAYTLLLEVKKYGIFR